MRGPRVGLGATGTCLFHINPFHNIANRAAQSNSVYVSVLKITIVHADSVRK